MLVVAVLAIAFWMVLLSPKRGEVTKLEGQVTSLESSLAQHRSEAEAAELARRSFAEDYRRLVLLGKAVPGGDETASLLVQLNKIADRAKVRFETLSLTGSEGSGEETSAAAGASGASPTEAAASLLPLGAAVGPAGLAVMPYSLTFEGSFFEVADFIDGLDDLVKTSNAGVAADGRLITIGGFSLTPSPEAGFPELQGSFTVTTYVTPPGEGLAAGLTPAGVGEGTTLASATTAVEP
jgi:Tfp pilus assembly protein PilO